MNGPPGVAAAELDFLLPRIAGSMRRPDVVIRAAGDEGEDKGERAPGDRGPASGGGAAVVAGLAAAARAAAPACGRYDSASDVTFALATELSSVKIARTMAGALLRRWRFEARADDVMTVISELVTNALRHGMPHAAREWAILLRLIKNHDTVMCAVADASTIPPVVREPNFVAETGRGLHVVQSYSRRWGWAPRPHGEGKIVWAVFW